MQRDPIWLLVAVASEVRLVGACTVVVWLHRTRSLGCYSERRVQGNGGMYSRVRALHTVRGGTTELLWSRVPDLSPRCVPYVLCGATPITRHGTPPVVDARSRYLTPRTVPVPRRHGGLFLIQAVTGVFFGPHSSFEHFWVRDAGDLEALMGGDGGDGYRPRVFISRGKHASYPIEGTGMSTLPPCSIVFHTVACALRLCSGCS